MLHKQIGDDTHTLLETLIHQGEKNNTEPVLEALIHQNGQNTDKIVEAITAQAHAQTPVTEATSKMAAFLHEMTGPKGDKGDTGEQGDSIQGERGEMGEPGADSTVPGPAGLDGVDGRDGIDGRDGRDGIDGIDGKSGRDGKDAIGKQGPKGDDGKPDTQTTDLFTKLAKKVDGIARTSGHGTMVTYRVGGALVSNGSVLNLIAGSNVTLTPGQTKDGADITINATGGGGGGDVAGPASSVNNNVALFNGITGKLIKDSGLALSGINTGDKTAYITVGATKADYITDGTADDVEINQAVQAAIAAGGGTVLIKAGTYNLAATIALNGNNITLLGTGEGTLLKTANASNVNPITVSGTGRINVKIKMMKIDCNRANNTFGAGIVFNTPWSATDPNHVLEDLYIVNCKNNGIEFTASSDTRVPLFRNIHIQDCDGNGLYMPNPSSTDGIFENIIVDRTGLNGIYIGGANHHFVNCKTFYCGSIAGNNHGFYINGYNNYFTNCEAQDNYQSGFYLDATGDATYGARGNTFVNCIADSNGQALNAAYSAGWQIVNTPDTQIIGGVAMTRPYPSFTQVHGIRMTGTTTRTNVVGMWFSANTNPWTDASSGTNYRSLCTGQSTETSTVPGAITMGQNAINIGSGTAKIYGTGARPVIDGGSQPLQLDNVTQVYYNSATPTIDMFNVSARTLLLQNGGGGAANLQVTNDIKSRTQALIGATSGQINIVPAAVASGTQTLPAGTGTLISSATNLAANPVTGTPSSSNFLRGDGTWATPAAGGGMVQETPTGTVNGTNVTFTVTVAPKFIVTDTGFYIAGFGFSLATLTITMDLAPNTFIRAYS